MASLRNNIFLSVLRISVAIGFFLLGFRMLLTGTEGYFFLVWNLFLAAIPYWAATLFERISVRESRARRSLSALFLLWLFFFPNAPYIVTDFIHLPWEYRMTFRFVYDFAIVGMFALAGLLLGTASLFRVHRVLRSAFGKPRADASVVLILFLSGVGIYLGRFLRWNSWDMLFSPVEIFRDTVAHYGDPAWSARAVFLSLLFSAFTAISYAIFAGAYRFLGERGGK